MYILIKLADKPSINKKTSISLRRAMNTSRYLQSIWLEASMTEETDLDSIPIAIPSITLYNPLQ